MIESEVRKGRGRGQSLTYTEFRNLAHSLLLFSVNELWKNGVLSLMLTCVVGDRAEYREATVRANGEGHKGLAGRRIVGGMRRKAQDLQARNSLATTSSWYSLSGSEEGVAG